MYETILYEKSGAVLTITLNRPDRFNAFTEQLHKDLAQAIDQAAKDDEVRVVILTGAGKAFCSGQDLKDIQGKPGRDLGNILRKHYNPNMLRLRTLEKPVICKLNGVAAGAGMSLALNCDLIIASEAASLIEIFVNVGLVPDAGSTWILPRLCGYHKAFELCSTGRKISADEALRLHIANEVVPTDQLDARVQEIAQYYAQAPTKAIGMIKRVLNRTASMSYEDTLEYEAQLQEICGATEDYEEGLRSFAEKRKPEFRGR